MPARNAEATIAASLISAIEQSRPASEIIVVDDGSSDNTSALVDAMASRHATIRLIRQERRGPMVARNRAIAESSGQLIAPLDADDLWHPDYLARLAGALDGTGAGFAYALYRVVDERGNIIHDGPDFECEGWTTYRQLLVNFVGNGSCAVFDRTAVMAVGGYPVEALAWGGAEDYLLQMRIAANRPVARVGAYLVAYRRSSGSYSAQSPVRSHFARMQAVQSVADLTDRDSLRAFRWADADGRRVAAALLASRSDWSNALQLALQAAWLDPLGSLTDLSLRLRNAANRAITPTVRQRKSFFGEDPDIGDGRNRVDPILRRRLRKLAAAENPIGAIRADGSCAPAIPLSDRG